MIIELDYDSILFTIEIITPFRPPPICNNPSDPAYSDVGDNCEFEIIETDPQLTENELQQYYNSDRFYEKVVNKCLGF
jgi:hypothetical protein